jgi:ligand-binding sensor domain-containing protein
VVDIAEDLDGGIWVSLAAWGIARLDRRTYRFRRYMLDDLRRRSLGGSSVRALLNDGRGGVLIGTDSGLFRFDTRAGRCARILHDSARRGGGTEVVTSLMGDRRGRVWIGTMGDRYYRYDARSGTVASFAAEHPGGLGMRFVGEDARGFPYLASDVWRGTGACLWRIDPEAGTAVARLTVQGKGYAIPYAPSDGSNVWIWISGNDSAVNGLYSIPFGDGDNRIALDPARRAVDCRNEVRGIVRDRSGIAWAATIDGIYKLVASGTRFTTYRSIPGDPYSLSSDRIRAVHLDARGRLWVGTDRGLNRLDSGGHRWRRYFTDPADPMTPPSDRANTIFEEPDGTLLIGTNAGIGVYHPARDIFTGEYLGPPASTFGIAVWSLRRDREGRLWVGTRDSGIYVFDRARRPVMHLLHDARDAGSLAQGVVWAMHEDRRGRLWVGADGGLCRWMPERGRFKVYHHDPRNRRSLGFDNVCAITEDAAGAMWLGTHGGGICRYDAPTDDFTAITSREGLPDNAVYGLLADGLGRFWISSNSGLTVYDPIAGSFRTYNVNDGLPGNEFSFGSFLRAPNGEFLFGGVDGLARFMPESLHADAMPPPVVITSFKVFDRAVYHQLADGDVLEVPYDHNFIAFEFAALDYMDPAANRHAYRLEGFDPDWIYCGDRRYASFTNLDPGTYTFHVKGANNDGVWNDRGMRVVVRVIPPFWMTLWFRAAAAAAILAAAAAAVLARTRSIRGKYLLKRRSAESQLRALRLQMSPHFIFNSLGSIQHLILMGESEKAMEYLARFSRLVRRVLENSRRDYISLAEEVEILTLYLDLESLRFDERFAYRIDIDPELDPRGTRIPTMLIQPLLENAIRHGLLPMKGTGLVAVTLARCDATIHCIVEDNGVGREYARAAELRAEGRRSIGMSATAERLGILNAGQSRGINMRVTDLFDESGAPAGTRVELFIPMEFSGAEYSSGEFTQ